MTKVNFYRVADELTAALLLTCDLSQRAWQRRSDVLINCPQEALAEQLDELLWCWSPTSFLPHAHQDDPGTVRLCVNDDPGHHHGTLINLGTETPDWFGRFEILCELIYGDSEHVDRKRQRYKFYKDRGYPLSYHDLADRYQGAAS